MYSSPWRSFIFVFDDLFLFFAWFFVFFFTAVSVCLFSARFVDLTFGVYDNDPKMMCDGAEQMGILRTDVDRTSIEVTP